MAVQEQPAVVRSLQDTVVQRNGVMHDHQAEMNSLNRHTKKTQKTVNSWSTANHATPIHTGKDSREIWLLSSPAESGTVSVQAVSPNSDNIPSPGTRGERAYDPKASTWFPAAKQGGDLLRISTQKKDR